MNPNLGHFVCRSCHAINRVDMQYQGRTLRCGTCKSSLPADGHPVEVDDAQLAALVGKSPVPVLVDFWAPWCGPCKMVAPELVRLGQRHAGRLIIAKIDTDQHQQTAAQLNVRAIPTLDDWCQTPIRAPRRDIRRAEVSASA